MFIRLEFFLFFFGKKSLHTPIKWRTPANAALMVHWYVCADIYTLRHKYMNYEQVRRICAQVTKQPPSLALHATTEQSTNTLCHICLTHPSIHLFIHLLPSHTHTHIHRHTYRVPGGTHAVLSVSMLHLVFVIYQLPLFVYMRRFCYCCNYSYITLILK